MADWNARLSRPAKVNLGNGAIRRPLRGINATDEVAVGSAWSLVHLLGPWHGLAG